MMLHNKRQRLLLIALLLNLAFIWGNSLLPPEQSNALSDSVTEALGGEVATDESTEPERWLTSGHVRKSAHALEFALLGVLATLLACPSQRDLRRMLPYIALPGVITALLDETIQLFSERTSSVKDVWLDCFGFALGMLLAAVCWVRKRDC